jgi:hypothetical protein
MSSLDILLNMLRRGRQLSHNQKVLIGVSTFVVVSINLMSSSSLMEIWPIIGIVFAICSSIICMIGVARGGGVIQSSTPLAICLLGLAVSIMQYEENGIDIMNRKSHFTPYSNNVLASVVPFFRCADPTTCAFNPQNVMALNTVGLWLPMFLLPWLHTTNPLFALFVIAYTVGNVAGLVGAAMWTLSYAPGMASGILFVLPSAYWCTLRIIRHQFYGDRLLFVVCAVSSPWLFGCIGGLVFAVDMTHILPSFVWPMFMAVASVAVPYICGKMFGYNIEAYHERLRAEGRRGDSELDALL